MNHIDFSDTESIKSAMELGKGVFDFIAAASKLQSPSMVSLTPAQKEQHLKTYLNTFFNKIAFQKTFLSPETPVSILSQCIDASVTFNDNSILLDEFCYPNLPQIVCIQGSAGQGKSTALKRLALRTMLSGTGIPFFVELRDIKKGQIIEGTCVAGFGRLFDGVSPRAAFESLCAQYNSYLFLDGLDEVANDMQREIVENLSEIISRNPSLTVILSSRPDDLIQGLSWLPVAIIERLQPLGARKLVELCPCHGEAKAGILYDFDTLFNRYREFFEIPLLLTIFILAFAKNPDVPSEPHEFFRQAFTALFSEHDSYKVLFKRERHVNLGLLEYQKVVGAFCAVTLSKKQFSFEKAELLPLLQSSLHAAVSECNVEDLLIDLERCTCILQRDGLKYSFTHRSFQDYLAATFTEFLGDHQIEAMRGAIRHTSSLSSFGIHYIGLNKKRSWQTLVLPTLLDAGLDLERWPRSEDEVNKAQKLMLNDLMVMVIREPGTAKRKYHFNATINLDRWMCYSSLLYWFSITVDYKFGDTELEQMLSDNRATLLDLDSLEVGDQRFLDISNVISVDKGIVARFFPVVNSNLLDELEAKLQFRKTAIENSDEAINSLFD